MYRNHFIGITLGIFKTPSHLERGFFTDKIFPYFITLFSVISRGEKYFLFHYFYVISYLRKKI